MYRAVLDTCVLVPNLQRDFLLQLATQEAFAPVWGTGILTELDYTLAKLHERRSVSDSEELRHHLLTEIKHAFPGSEVNASKDRTYDYGLNDADDGHVAHAALIGKADAALEALRCARSGTDDRHRPTPPAQATTPERVTRSGYDWK